MIQRKPVVLGNWKLHRTVDESIRLAQTVANESPEAGVDVGIAPVFTALDAVHKSLGKSRLWLGAQNCHWQETGAFTGEVSASLLKDVGVQFVIVGHSERRSVFAESLETVQRKLNAVLQAAITAVLCVGETLEQRGAGQTLEVVLGQTRHALSKTESAQMASVIVAYEPVWAIGTGKNASPADAQAVHAALREELAKTYGAHVAEGAKLLYGGSVKPDNAEALFAMPDIDGALVGGASLEEASFLPIVKAALKRSA